MKKDNYMSTDAKYLRITMHDNDFSESLNFIAQVLCKIFKYIGKYPKEEDIPKLTGFIAHLWYAVFGIIGTVYFEEFHKPVSFEYFQDNCKLVFVDYFDIPDWDNYESIYIPMFDGDILIR